MAIETILGVSVSPAVEERRVLDIPPIDMTDRKPTTSPAPRATENGSIGITNYARVRELVSAEGLKVLAAVRRVAVETGQSPSAVRTNYYRIARKEGTVRPQKAGKARTGRSQTRQARPAQIVAAKPSGTAAPMIDEIGATLVTAVEQLTAAMSAQQAEITDLRRRLEGVRAIIG